MNPTKQTNSIKQTGTGAPQGLAEWLTFPALGEAWAGSPEKTIAQMAERAADYRRRSGSGSAAERVRARLIASGYQRVQALLEELHAMEQAAARKRS